MLFCMQPHSAIVVGAIVFVSTNIDDILLLLGFFADPKFRTRDVVLGQYLGIGALYLASAAASLVSLVLDPVYIGLLGIVPIAIGVKRLMALSNGREGPEAALRDRPNLKAINRCLAVTAVTLANGVDNLAIYTPLFAAESGRVIAMMGVIFALLTALWCAFAYWLVGHRMLGLPIRRYGHRITPFVLIGLGMYILLHAKN
jgi:cadmium resistance protein CadD (predicted permease)